MKGLSLRVWYVSKTRIFEVLKADAFSENLSSAFGHPEDGWSAGILANQLGSHILKLLKNQKILSLRSLALSAGLVPGMRFFYQGHLYGKGFGSSNKSKQCSLSEDVNDFLPGKRLVIQCSTDGLTTQTAQSRLNGSVNLFALCAITEINGGHIIAVPYVIGDLVAEFKGGIEFPFVRHARLALQEIDQLKPVDWTRQPSKAAFMKLKETPEKVVKTVLCKIFSEFSVPTDWGGEQCDIFTSNLSVEGHSLSAAMLLKGPARFHEMQMTDCGKNGDQVYRLFSVPADVFIVQHCHKISPAVRRTVEAFTVQTRFTRPCRYALIDGYDTCRILRAFPP